MCTLTWVRAAQLNSSDSSGYHIHFNRDESRQRSTAHPPQSFSNQGVEFLAPIDQDALGTWIFVNSWGFSACLLNNYIDIKIDNKASSNKRSRGLLVKDLSQAKDIEQSLRALDSANIEHYSPFDLYLFDRQQVYAVGWNGESRVDTENPEPFKSSSGFNTEAVSDARQKYYSRNPKTTESLRDFHRSHTPNKSAYSACMHREDACTQSYTEISADDHKATMRYSDGSPCEAPLSCPLSIKLQQLIKS